MSDKEEIGEWPTMSQFVNAKDCEEARAEYAEKLKELAALSASQRADRGGEETTNG